MSEPVGVPAFSNHLPVRIRFGDRTASQLGSVAAGYGARRAVVMADAGLEDGNAGVASAIETLQDAGVEVERFVKPPGEPTIELADAA
ncbi:MAG TPA: iron-containing alcohol dehydrogenase, partial [Solirubrobacteraceae bacterium]